MSDQAIPVGRVISVDGAKLQGILCNGKDGKRGKGGNGATMPDGASRNARVQIGAVVKVATPRSRVFGMVSSLVVADPAAEAGDSRQRLFEVELLGEMPDGEGGNADAGFQRGVAMYPVLDDDIFLATRDELGQIYARPAVSNVRIGTVHPDHELPAYLLTDDLLGKHFAILGSTGSGKSCSAALILRALLAEHRNGHVVLLDPHNEYSHAFGDIADVIHSNQLQLPYWLLNFEEIIEVIIGRGRPNTETEAAILKKAIIIAKHKFMGGNGDANEITVDTPVPYNLSDLLAVISNEMGQLNKPENSIPYLRLKTRLENLRADRRYGFMFSGLVVKDALPDILARILSIPVAGKPITILDLSGVPSEIVDVVVSLMCRMIFDFALWSVPAQALPVLLVCEEAHRYVPRDSEAGFGPTKKIVSRIAMEGRKYGVSLCLVSQRPSELSPNILSQCNTLFALRMSNERDQEIVRRALPENALGLLGELPSLRTQEAVVVGEGVTLPVRLRFDDLEEQYRPKSGSAEFSTRWQREDKSREFVDQTIERWRAQAR